jgi:rod shape determining protein RodA
VSAVLQSPSLWQRLKPVLAGYDLWLSVAVAALAAIGLVTMYSAGFDHGTRFVDHGRNMLLALGVLFSFRKCRRSGCRVWPCRCTCSAWRC